MIEPRRWTLAELERDAKQATSVFREERLKESLNQYSNFFEHFSSVFRELEVVHPRSQALLGEEQGTQLGLTLERGAGAAN